MEEKILMDADGAFVERRRVIRWIQWTGLVSLAAFACMLCVLWLGQHARIGDYFVLSAEYIADQLENVGSFPLHILVLIVAVISVVMAWFRHFPESIRFLVLLASLFIARFSITSYGISDGLDPVTALMIVLAVLTALAALFVMQPRVYWRGTGSVQRILVLSLLALGVLKYLMVLDFCAQHPSDSDEGYLLVVLLAAWLLLSRAKFGWLLALLLAAAELVFLGLNGWTLTDIPREPVIPALIVILLLTPPVFRWYFPRKDASVEVPDG